ncbi:hypothetical protein BDK51DRAFT_33201, partial [Blyttiomyces helicus]
MTRPCCARSAAAPLLQAPLLPCSRPVSASSLVSFPAPPASLPRLQLNESAEHSQGIQMVYKPKLQTRPKWSDKLRPNNPKKPPHSALQSSPHRKMVSIAAINIYPIKGVVVNSATVDECGFELDRFWILSDPEHNMVTQRMSGCSRMVTIVPRLEFNAIADDDTEKRIGAYRRGGRMVVSAPGMEDLVVPFPRPPGGTPVCMKVWEHDVDGLDEGDEAAEWFSRFLKRP